MIGTCVLREIIADYIEETDMTREEIAKEIGIGTFSLARFLKTSNGSPKVILKIFNFIKENINHEFC